MIELSPMTEPEYEAYLEQAIVSYADEKVVSGNWSPETALERSRKEFAELLSRGLETPDQHLHTVGEGSTGQAVGVVWFEVQRMPGLTKAYVCDLMIDPECRRKGYATDAMNLVEAEARRMGCTDISLHVFAHNEEAVALYRKLGFVVTNLVMARGL